MPARSSALPERVLVLSDRPWLPARSGGEIRTRSLVQALAGLCSVEAFTVTGSFGRQDVAGVRLHDSRHGGAERIGRAFGSLDWLRRPDGHPTDAMFSPDTVEELEALFPPGADGVVVLESLGLQAYVEPLVSAGYRVVLYTHGVQALLAAELAASQPGSLGRIVVERTRQAEARAFAAVDQVWVCSTVDAARVQEEYGSEIAVHLVPNTVAVPAAPRRRDRNGALGVVYPGTLDYPPNREAALRLARTILPLVRGELPDAHVTLVGRNPPDDVLAAGEAPGVTVTGEVADVEPYLATADALVVPIETGSGTRLKILEAFAAGLPVISSATGIEGIEAVPGRHYLAAETDAEFAAALVRLDREPEAGVALAQNAFALVRDSYSIDALPAYLAPALTELAASRGPAAGASAG